MVDTESSAQVTLQALDGGGHVVMSPSRIGFDIRSEEGARRGLERPWRGIGTGLGWLWYADGTQKRQEYQHQGPPRREIQQAHSDSEGIVLGGPDLEPPLGNPVQCGRRGGSSFSRLTPMHSACVGAAFTSGSRRRSRTPRRMATSRRPRVGSGFLSWPRRRGDARTSPMPDPLPCRLVAHAQGHLRP